MEEKKPKGFIGKIKSYYNKWLYSAALVIIACAYILLLSDSNFRRHKQLNEQAKSLEFEIVKVENQIANSYTYDEISANPQLLEQYVRENLKMQRPGEEVFVIEYKTVEE